MRFAGFRCEQESAWDQGSGADEPYFIIALLGTNGSKTVKFGPYEDVNSGTIRVEGGYVIEKRIDAISPPILLGAAGVEHDYGSTEEAEEKIRQAIKDIEGKLDKAAGAFMGVSVDNHVMPEWLRDLYVGWGPELGAALFGLADDEIGKNAVWLFDYKPEGGEWAPYPEIGTLDKQKYTHELKVDGGDQGIYTLFFHVRAWLEKWKPLGF